MVVDRGGRQVIPRPPNARPGAPAPWAALAPGERRFTTDDVRAAAATFPPPSRPTPPETARLAAVLMAVFDEGDGEEREARVILTKRPDTMPSHQGEIAFPGGKQEEHDDDLEAAALREAHEEVGLDPANVEVVGELDSLTTVAGRFVLTPFVGLLAERPALVPDPTEVVSVFDVAVSGLLEDGVFREELWDIPEGLGVTSGPGRSITFFELDDETVWGATARILTVFLERLTATRAG